MIHATTIVLKPRYYIANGEALPRCAFFPHSREPQARRAVVIARDSKGGFPIHGSSRMGYAQQYLTYTEVISATLSDETCNISIVYKFSGIKWAVA